MPVRSALRPVTPEQASSHHSARQYPSRHQSSRAAARVCVLPIGPRPARDDNPIERCQLHRSPVKPRVRPGANGPAERQCNISLPETHRGLSPYRRAKVHKISCLERRPASVARVEASPRPAPRPHDRHIRRAHPPARRFGPRKVALRATRPGRQENLLPHTAGRPNGLDDHVRTADRARFLRLPASARGLDARRALCRAVRPRAAAHDPRAAPHQRRALLRRRARARPARPAVAATWLRGRLRVRQAAPLPDRPRVEERAAGRNADARPLRSARREANRRHCRRRRLRPDPRPHAAHGAGGPARRAAAPACRSCTTSTARPAATRRAASSNWINALVEWPCLRDADRLIAVSPSLRQYMIDRGIRGRARRLRAQRRARAPATSQRAPPPGGTWTLGTVALFRPRKGIEVLLEALAALRSRGVNVRLRAVGGFETPAYEAAILAPGRAARPGRRDRLDRLHARRQSRAGEDRPVRAAQPVRRRAADGRARSDGRRRAGRRLARRRRARSGACTARPACWSSRAASANWPRAIEEIVGGDVDYAALSRGARRRHAELFSDATMAAGVNAVYRDVLK